MHYKCCLAGCNYFSWNPLFLRELCALLVKRELFPLQHLHCSWSIINIELIKKNERIWFVSLGWGLPRLLPKQISWLCRFQLTQLSGKRWLSLRRAGTLPYEGLVAICKQYQADDSFMTLETTCAAVSHWVLWRKTNVFRRAGVWHRAAAAAAGRGGWAAAERFIPVR